MTVPDDRSQLIAEQRRRRGLGPPRTPLEQRVASEQKRLAAMRRVGEKFGDASRITPAMIADVEARIATLQGKQELAARSSESHSDHAIGLVAIAIAEPEVELRPMTRKELTADPRFEVELRKVGAFKPAEAAGWLVRAAAARLGCRLIENTDRED